MSTLKSLFSQDAFLHCLAAIESKKKPQQETFISLINSPIKSAAVSFIDKNVVAENGDTLYYQTGGIVRHPKEI